MSACTTGPEVGSYAPGAPTGLIREADGTVRVEASGDWDDVEAALIPALGLAEMAQLNAELDEGVKRFEIIDALDRRGFVEVLGNEESGVNELRARIGLTGDPEAAAGLLVGIARRLKDLVGRETAPIR
ncbi:MAG: hypothetical protein AAGB51_03690 [Planctomycetota bacterium]